MKKILALALVLILSTSFTTVAFAGRNGHRGGHHSSRNTAVWHTAPYGWRSHWSSQCDDFGHFRNHRTGRWSWHHN